MCLKPKSDPVTALHRIPGGSSVPRGYAQAIYLPTHQVLITPPDLCCPLPSALCPAAYLSTPVSSLLEASGSAISHTHHCRDLAVTPPQSDVGVVGVCDLRCLHTSVPPCGVCSRTPLSLSSLVSSRAGVGCVLTEKGLPDLKVCRSLPIPQPEHPIFTRLWEYSASLHPHFTDVETEDQGVWGPFHCRAGLSRASWQAADASLCGQR